MDTPIQSRCSSRILTTATLFFLLMSPLEAQDVLSVCVAENGARIVGIGSTRLCLVKLKPELVYMEAAEGTNFSSMAALCCIDPGAIVAQWSSLQGNDKAQQGKWYPIPKSGLAPTFAGKMRGDNVPAPTPGPTNPSDGPPSTPGTHGKINPTTDVVWDANKIVYGTIAIVLFSATLILIVLVLGLRKAAKLRTAVEIKRWEQLTELLTGALRGLEQGLLVAVNQKVSVEMLVPASNSTEWIAFARLLKEELGRLPGTPGDGFGREAEGGGLGFAPAQPPLRLAGPATKGGVRILAVRDTAYGMGSDHFGGRVVFNETREIGAAFCISVEEGGTGLLTPNPDAREYDSFFQQLFGLSRNDFIGKAPTIPKRVKFEDGKWVIASSR